MKWYMPWVAFAVALILTTALTPWVRKLAFRFGAVAVPRDRDVHKEPLPRWGGIAMAASFVVTLGLVFVWVQLRHAYRGEPNPWTDHQMRQMAGVAIATAFVAVIGIIDDKLEISAKWQTLALIAAGLILWAFGVSIDGVTNPVHGPVVGHLRRYDPQTWLQFPKWFSCLATVAWVFLVTKTVDFLDGLDGLAAGVCAICAGTLALLSAQAGQYEVTIVASTVVGCCLGFLRYNYNPATIIMGTVGAQFLGFVLAAISIVGTFKIAATVAVALPMLVFGVPLFDGLRVLATRALRGQPVTVADRTTHIHHVLLNRGLSQKRAVWYIYGLTAFLCILALIIFARR